MVKLRFPLSDVRALAEHAVAALSHKPSFADSVDGTTPVPALWLVGDDGLYLMSNGLPGRPYPAGGASAGVVHADGFRTAMSKHAIADQIGGDDFCQPLPLLIPGSDGVTLHARLAAGAANGWDLFVIELDTAALQFYLAARG